MWTRLLVALRPNHRPSRPQLTALHAEANQMACARGDHAIALEFRSLGDFTEMHHVCTRCGDRQYMGEHRPGMHHG